MDIQKIQVDKDREPTIKQERRKRQREGGDKDIEEDKETMNR